MTVHGMNKLVGENVFSGKEMER